MSQRRLIALEGQFPAFLAASIMPVLLMPLANEVGPFPQPLVAPVVFDLLILQSVRTLPVLQPTFRGRCIGALYQWLGFVTGLPIWVPPLFRGWPSGHLQVATLLLVAIFFITTSVRLVRLLARVPRVNLSVLAGAAGGYVHLGLTGGMVATAIEVVHPGSFLLGAVGSHEALRDRLLYYSFVTVAGLGYGDVLPGNPVGERFAILLSVSSTLYVSLLVGLLLGRFIAHEAAELEEHWQEHKTLASSPPDRLPMDDQ
ncbi:two pore domain potassium channel family protein [Synechococcus sp. CBW1002]|uniref:two pore domain potassium channel family protein n=1 Tax=Synechococcus sp. CBW1002 TaxID=1353134 RepID=UPI0018CEE747|nr:two pore domain potassium channel family protein [Synechococcus sp. CBW1002]QPN61251.1 two pore domain potassium channel family protein [Synechococcus sp. CBW1002]